MSSNFPGRIRSRLLLLLLVVGGCGAAASGLTPWPAPLALIALALGGLFLTPGWALVLGLALAGAAALAWLGLVPGFAAPVWWAWLWLLGLAVLPRLASGVTRQVGEVQGRLTEQERLLTQQAERHPVTGLPGPGLARMFLGMLQAEYHRSGGRGAALAVTVTDLHLAHQVYDAGQVASTLRQVHDALRGELRLNDWIFQLSDDRFLVLANVGAEPEGHLVMGRRVGRRLERIQRVTLQTQALLLPDDAALGPLLDLLLGQPPLMPPPLPPLRMKGGTLP